MAYKLFSMLLQVLILFVVPPFFAGVINRTKSILSGRKGPPIFQLYYDIIKLLKKDAVYSRSTSLLFKAAPVVILASVICAGGMLPMTGSAPLNFAGDAILFVYLFALSRFFMITAALDTASSFEGMGASREATFGSFSELTTFIVIITLAVITRSLSLNGMFLSGSGHLMVDPSMLLLFLTFFFILLTESSRMPVDDPNTHLELTMIHEVMILDYSGPDLGLMLYGASMKLFVFMVFAVMLIYPSLGNGALVDASLLLIKVTVLAIAIGIVESVTARIRLIKIPQILFAAFILSMFALLMALFVRGRL